MKRRHRRRTQPQSFQKSRTRRRPLRFEFLEGRDLLATFDLAFADVTIFGVDANDESGIAVSNAGDVNGDGFDELLIGARYGDAANNAKNAAGDSYLVFGRADMQATTTIDLAFLGANGVRFFGADIFDYSGRSLSTAGDVNGDGFDDLLIAAVEADGTAGAEPQSGESYIVFGKADWSTTQTIDFANLGSNGVTLLGTDAFDLSGRSVSNAGDVNGDGFDEVLIGAHAGDGANNGRVGSGESILLFGRATWSTQTIDLGNLGTTGVTIFGANQGDDSGFAVGGGGDVNGDGFDDLIIGAQYGDAANNAKNAAGDSYIVFGKANWSATLTLDLATLGTAGVTIFGADVVDNSGVSVSNAGDVNGDGFDDVLIGAVFADLANNATPNAGESYLLFGKATWPTTLDLANLGSAGVIFNGVDTTDNSGLEVSGAGDINGDGFDDLLIGARYGDGLNNAESNAGESYLVFGKASWSSTFNLATIGSGGVVFFGPEVNDYSGFSLSTAGDLDGDGFDDLIIGAARGDAASNAKSNAGESFVLFGSDDFTSSVDELGTDDPDTLTGNTGSDIMVGHRDDDLLVGAGGADVLRGGEGDDVLAVSDLTYQRLVGGNGTDTIRLDGSGHTLDLTTRRDNRTLGIEQINLTGSGANTLTLNVLEVFNLSDESNTLIVFRDANDTVNRGTGWTRGADEVINGNIFEVYTQGAAILKIQTSISDIAMTKTASVDSVLAGNSYFYTMQVTSTGPSAATGVVVTDSLPANLAFDAANSSSTCSAAGSEVTCNLGTIAVGGSKSAQIGVKVASSVAHGTVISNTATVTANESDPTPGDHSSTDTVTVNREADLTVNETASANPAIAGGPLNFTILIENRGPSDASNVVATSTLPAGLTFFANNSTGGCSAVGQLVTCNVGTIAAGMNTAPRIGTIVSSSLATGTQITNTVDVTLSESDPTTGDHSDTETVTVNRQVNVQIAKTASNNPVIAGSSFSYTIQVANLGPSDASGVDVTDTLPNGLTFNSTQSSNGCSAVGQQVACPIGDLAANGNRMFGITVDVSSTLTRGTVLTNTANVSINEFDTNPNNQSSTISVTVNVDPDPFPWQNVINRRDVNNDGSVSPIDALIVINELNSPKHSGANGQLPVPAPPGDHPFLDVSGDNFAAPNDALIVINFLNGGSGGEGESGTQDVASGTDSFPVPIYQESQATRFVEPVRRNASVAQSTHPIASSPTRAPDSSAQSSTPRNADAWAAMQSAAGPQTPFEMELEDVLDDLIGNDEYSS